MNLFSRLMRRGAPFILAALLMTVFLPAPISSASTPFKDLGTTYAETIQYLQDKGVVQGYSGFLFSPEKSITRAEFIKILLKNYGFDPDTVTQYSNHYIDVPRSMWFAPYIERAFELGILDDKQAIYPNEPITRVEAAKHVLSLLGVSLPRVLNENEWTLSYKDVSYDAWFAPIVLYAQNYGLLGPLDPASTDYFSPVQRMSRGEATQLVYNTDVYLYGNQIIDSTVETENGPIYTTTYSTVTNGSVTYDIPNFDIFLDVWTQIHENFYGHDNLDDEALMYQALEGLMEALGDPYSVFMDPPASTELDNVLTGTLSGIGATLFETDEGVIIQNFLQDSPGEAAGLKVNDIITAVDGVDVTGMSASDLGEIIRGDSGTTVQITVKRTGTTAPLTYTYTVTREVLNFSYISGEIIKNDILYIDINLFDDLSFIDFTQTVTDLIEEDPNYTGMIVDLRDNGGGYLNSVHSVIGHFIPYGQAAFFVEYGENASSLYLSTGNGEFAKLPLVILINENTASAAEIMAIALKEKADAILVGKTTYGKGTVQSLTSYADGSSLKLTIAEWRSPEFHSINNIGLSPHYDVSITDENIAMGQDPQLNKAIEIMKREIEKNRDAEEYTWDLLQD
ncbi:MAG: S41 family peptidase [Candidatus Gracilibacteria bacterium]